MSAIFGMLRFDGGEASQRDMERLSKALAHRGPDGRKSICEGPVGLGHGLMRVNQEDRFEAQPLHDPESKLTLVADCRIDNRETLAASFGLDAAQLRDMPDSALILRAYKKWGEDCAQHLLGDFAFAIWDASKGKLVLGREHMGQRYVHYHHAKEFFIFATEVKALWSSPDVPRAISDAQLGKLMMGARPSGEGETLFEGIQGVPGGTVMTIGADGLIKKYRYWQPHADPTHENQNEAYYVEAYRRVLGEAVACRIRRTLRPPGVMFSGGYDSAAIAGLAGPALVPSGHKLIAAASVMPADYRGNIRHARPWVEMCARDMPHLDVHYVTREGMNVLTGLNEAFLESGQPAGSYHFVNRELLATLKQAGAQLVMDGHGGDYTLHPRGQAALARFLVRLQFRRFTSELRGQLRLSGHSLWVTLKNDVAAVLIPPAAWALWRRVRRGFSPLWRDQPINPSFAKQLVADGVLGEKSLRAANRPQTDMRGSMMEILQRQSQLAAPGNAVKAALHGLELTRPFHDKRVVELALAIPQDLYVKHGRNRYLACRALKDVYPREFQNRGRLNDDEIPDFQRMAKSIEPQLLADIARMEKSENLPRIFDFGKIRSLLAARGIDDHNSGWEQETQLALRGFTIARYIEWFRRDNR